MLQNLQDAQVRTVELNLHDLLANKRFMK
jgi:hypothetical protein